jgi:DNA-binding transcriptional MerR regulator
VSASVPSLNPSEAARRLGVSAKALRLYEQRGLVSPLRTGAGWRVYGPGEMVRAEQIVGLRGLGLSLAQVARVLGGDAGALAAALAAHQARLESRSRETAEAIDRVRALRSDLAQGRPLSVAAIAGLVQSASEVHAAFDLPWPWGGERFELRGVRRLTFIIGPLGSGKTRLARRLAEALPGGVFLPMERTEDDGVEARAKMAANPHLKARVEAALAWMVEDGASETPALLTLLLGLEAEGSGPVVVDMVEQGLDQATQQALIANLRRRDPGAARPLFLMTRSSAILDLADVLPDEAILLCPANHSPPRLVSPYPGAPGYEAVATCLASPQVRARTAGMIAWRPEMA